ncbi:MAG: DUF120 domain-containing protein [Thermoplasmata archaeon]
MAEPESVQPELIRILKELALLGGITGTVMITSGELAKRLGMSQQSASNKIIQLVEEGLVTRRMGPRKQALQLTPKGVGALRREHSDYLKIFEGAGRLLITGQVTSGFGEGGYYVGQEAYQAQFRQKLGMKPYPGTLNLRVSGQELAKLMILKESPGITLEGFTRDGRTFGNGRMFRARIRNLYCAVVIPHRSHYSDMIEVICEKKIRDVLGLRDGDSVRVEVIL